MLRLNSDTRFLEVLLRGRADWSLAVSKLGMPVASHVQRIRLEETSVHLWFLRKLPIAAVSSLAGLDERPLWDLLRENYRARARFYLFCLVKVENPKSARPLLKALACEVASLVAVHFGGRLESFQVFIPARRSVYSQL